MVLVIILHLLFKQGHKYISINTPFVCLINNIHIKLPPSHNLPNGHTISHKRNLSLTNSPLLLKSYTIPNLLSNLYTHLLTHTLSQCDCTYTTGLSYEDVFIVWVQELGDLGCFAAACLPADYCCLGLGDLGEDLGFVLVDWQGWGYGGG
jgi:hypothetical protein